MLGDKNQDELAQSPSILEPKLSLNVEESGEIDVEDGFQLPSPRLSLRIDDGDHTERSVEMARHGISEQPDGNVPRRGIEIMRTMDRFWDTSELQLDTPMDTSVNYNLVQRQHSYSIDDLDERDREVVLGSVGFPLVRFGRQLMVRRVDKQDLRRILDDGSNTEESRRIDSVPWGLFEYDDVGKSTLVQRSILQPSLRRNRSGSHEGPDHWQTEVVPISFTRAAPELKGKSKAPESIKISRQGLPYSSLPSGIMKSLSSTLAISIGMRKTSISSESLESIKIASDWFFQQLGDDLGTYAGHAGRRKINERDIASVMKR